MNTKPFVHIPLNHLFITIVMIVEALGNATDNVGDKLIKEVFDGYQNDVRPVCSPYPYTLYADLGIAIRQLIELNNPEQKLSTSIWFRTRWHDCRLTWELSRYQNLSRVIVPMTRMWVPDLTLYENSESKLGEKDEYYVSVTYTGQIEFNMPAVVKSMCKLNVAMFPFDYQTCFLTLGSWMYTIQEVNLTARKDNPVDMSSYIPHGEWTLYRLDFVDRVLLGYDGFGYAQVLFTLHLHRKSLFYIVNLILPGIIVKSLAIIGFLLPPESGEKLNLEITVLLSLLVFQLVILNSMPNSSKHLPVIAIYFLMSMILTALSCVGTVLVLNIHFNKHTTPLPKFFRKIVSGYLGRVFRLSLLMIETEEKLQRLQMEYKQRQHQLKPLSESKSIPTYGFLQNGSETCRNGTDRWNPQVRFCKRGESEDDAIYGFVGYNNPVSAISRHQTYSVSPQAGFGRTSFFSLNVPDHNSLEPEAEEDANVAVSREILAHLESKSRSGTKKQINELVETEWKLFAVFLDRFFMFLFLGMGVITALAVFTNM